MPLRQPGARVLGRDRGPHQGNQRQNTRGAEEDGLGGAGPPVDKHTHWPTRKLNMKRSTVKYTNPVGSIMLLGIIHIFMLRLNNGHSDALGLK